ncbi:MAG TPA: glycosyltransferase family 39 protein, partial [Pirellulales bacterium]|nr:glycosyltransferase family 39 protein [Pirellulales bacterium]
VRQRLLDLTENSAWGGLPGPSEPGDGLARPAHRGTRYGTLAAAVLLGGLCQFYIVSSSPIIAKDGIGFIRIAKSLAIDPLTTLRVEDQHPGYPAMLLGCERAYRWLTGRDEFDSFLAATRLASGGCGLLSIVFLWLFARRLYDERIANVSVLLAAVWPLLRLNASDSLSDTPHLMFYLAGAWLAMEGLRSRRMGWFAGAGLASSLAFAVRPEGLLVGVAAGLAVAWEFCRARYASQRILQTGSSETSSVAGAEAGRARPGIHKNARAASDAQVVALPGHRRGGAWGEELAHRAALPQPPLTGLNDRRTQYKAALTIAGVLAAASLVVVPYALLAGKITSKKLPFHRAVSEHERAMASVEPTTGLLAEPAPGSTLPDEFRRPSAFAGVVGLAIFELARELAQGFYYLALIPLAVGTFAPRRPKPNRRAAVMHVLLMNGHAALLLLLYLTAGYISHRHILPLVALMLPTAAAGAVCLAEAASQRLSFVGSPRRALAVVVFLFYVGLVPKCLKPLHTVYAPIYEAAECVKREARPGDSVLASSSYVRFYAGLPGIVVGSEAPNLPIGMYFAPGKKQWPFLVLEVDDRTFDRDALCGPSGQYDQILELPAHPRRPWAKVVVLHARQQRLGRRVGPASLRAPAHRR